MKREKIKIISIYILTFVLFALIAYLIYFVIDTLKNDNSDIKENAQESLVQDNCIFQVSVLEYNQIMNGQNTSICNGYNELNINDVIINGQTIEIKAIIFNGSNHNLNENEGLFIGGKRVLTETYNQYKSNLNLVNNLLYIVSKNENAINVQAFNGVDIIYDLNKTLAELKIADQVFNLLAQTDSTINPILTTNNIDQNSIAENFDVEPQNEVIIDYRARFFEEQAKNEQLEEQIKALNEKLSKDGMNLRTGGKLSPKTIHEYHCFIRAVLSQAVKELLVPFNVASKATSPKVVRKQANFIEQEDILCMLFS